MGKGLFINKQPFCASIRIDYSYQLIFIVRISSVLYLLEFFFGRAIEC